MPAAKTKRVRPVDEDGNPIPPEDRWAFVDGPWGQPPIHNRWPDFDSYMEQYGAVVDESNGLYTFRVKRNGLNDPSVDPDKRTLTTIFHKLDRSFDVDFLRDDPNGGGGKYSVQLEGPIIDRVEGKEKNSAIVSTFHKLTIPGNPNTLKKLQKKRQNVVLDDYDDYEDDFNGRPLDSGAVVARQLAHEQARARSDSHELAQGLLERVLDNQSSRSRDGDTVAELARIMADRDQHKADTTTQMFMEMMKLQAMQSQKPEPIDNSKEVDRLVRIIDQTKSDSRAALEEERSRNRDVVDQMRQRYQDQLASLKEERDRREREIKDDLEKTRSELREATSRLEDTKSKLSTVQLEKVSAEVKATLSGENPAATGGLSGFKKTLSDVKAIQQLVGGDAGGDDESWQSRLVSAVTDPRVATAFGGVAQSVVGALSQPRPQAPVQQVPQFSSFAPNPALPPGAPPPNVTQAQQAWQQQQAMLEAQRRQEEQQEAPVTQGDKQTAPPQARASKPPEEAIADDDQTIEDIIDSAAADGIPADQFLEQVLGQFGITLEEAKQRMANQTLDQVVGNLGIDRDKLTVMGKEYTNDIYQILQMTV